MQKQQASNSFSKGLNLDLSPIATPNDVLTGALNATFITYNGNEFMLQNDMGNGRVETARLPEGYIPVGMKEYGGIVYVASYNPNTGMGQVGSFPSPERNISSEDFSEESIQKGLTLNDFVTNGEVTKTTVTIKLIDNFKISAGDRFNFYLKGSGFDFLSNYFNVYKEKTASPRNNALTLQLAVKDAQGSLIDITDQLNRFNENGDILNKKDDVTYNNNLGYFMLCGSTDISTDPNKYRKYVDKANIYKYKVSGELYLVATLNIVQKLQTFVNATISDDFKNLTVEYAIVERYNCIDYNAEMKIKSSNIYHNLYGNPLKLVNPTKVTVQNSEKSFYFFNNRNNKKLLITNQDLGVTDSNLYEYKETTVSISNTGEKSFSHKTNERVKPTIEYDEVSNLYIKTSKFTVTYAFSENINNLYKYHSIEALPKMAFAKISSLTDSAEIEINKINRNISELNTWRYYVDTERNTIDINYGINYYKKDSIIESICIEFINVFSNSTYTYNIPIPEAYVINKNYNLHLNLGRCESEEDATILKGSLYVANLYIKYKEEPTRTCFANRWLFTTPIYNKYFDNHSYNDFKDLMRTTDLPEENKITFDKNSIVQPTFNTTNSKDALRTSVVEKNTNEPSVLTEETNQILNGYVKYNKKIQVNFEKMLELKNKEFYPFSFNKEGLNYSYTINNDTSFELDKEYKGNEAYNIYLPINKNMVTVSNNSFYISLFLDFAGSCVKETQYVKYLQPYLDVNNVPREFLTNFFGEYSSKTVPPETTISNWLATPRIEVGVGGHTNSLGVTKNILEMGYYLPSTNKSTALAISNIEQKDIINRDLYEDYYGSINTMIKNHMKNPVVTFLHPDFTCVDTPPYTVFDNGFIDPNDKGIAEVSQMLYNNQGTSNSYPYYYLVFWKGDDDKYYALDTLFYTSRPTTNNRVILNPVVDVCSYLSTLYYAKGEPSEIILNHLDGSDSNNYRYINSYELKINYNVNATISNIKSSNFSNINTVINTFLENNSLKEELLFGKENLFELPGETFKYDSLKGKSDKELSIIIKEPVNSDRGIIDNIIEELTQTKITSANKNVVGYLPKDSTKPIVLFDSNGNPLAEKKVYNITDNAFFFNINLVPSLIMDSTNTYPLINTNYGITSRNSNWFRLEYNASKNNHSRLVLSNYVKFVNSKLVGILKNSNSIKVIVNGGEGFSTVHDYTSKAKNSILL